MLLFRVTVGNMIPEVKNYFTTYNFSLANSLDSKTDSSLLKCKPLKKEYICICRHVFRKNQIIFEAALVFPLNWSGKNHYISFMERISRLLGLRLTW